MAKKASETITEKEKRGRICTLHHSSSASSIARDSGPGNSSESQAQRGGDGTKTGCRGFWVFGSAAGRCSLRGGWCDGTKMTVPGLLAAWIVSGEMFCARGAGDGTKMPRRGCACLDRQREMFCPSRNEKCSDFRTAGSLYFAPDWRKSLATSVRPDCAAKASGV